MADQAMEVPGALPRVAPAPVTGDTGGLSSAFLARGRLMALEASSAK